ncbi:SDR family NAD(P)-dependent oxidoreductase [Sagittula sp. MA-2]|jgi:3-oxoacyl-[acyl-carrier protein] reductase|uniref:SDR family NAD(P)-dependent oxidoreductase n=1 Tax=Sagittula sp. MA-2 TaxID=3048007 RepID=UPI0024C36F91|nr:SDR family oxidoreductase [Sagittula sp. MA-2]WHZ38086.1 SDR family oxidoreductase [Sagittula sp. MA-2]
MRRFEDQVAIVTGGARGIGLGIARRLTQEGAQVVVWDLADVAPGQSYAPAAEMKVDVTDPASVEAATADVLSRFGRIDVFVNNAGINGPVADVEHYDLADWKRVIDIDLTAVFLCCRAVIPQMKAQSYGRIVNIASIAGKEGVPGIAAYASAKAGVIGLTKSLAKELIRTGILVNAVAPVMVETDLLQQMTPEHVTASKAKIPMGRLLQIEELAALVAFVASPENSFTTGVAYDASGGRGTY